MTERGGERERERARPAVSACVRAACVGEIVQYFNLYNLLLLLILPILCYIKIILCNIILI